MAATVGLKSHIWNNNLRSVILLALYPLLLMVMVWAVCFVIGLSENHPQYHSSSGPDEAKAVAFANDILIEYWPMVLTVVLIWFSISWFFHTSMIRKLSHSHPVSRNEESSKPTPATPSPVGLTTAPTVSPSRGG